MSYSKMKRKEINWFPYQLDPRTEPHDQHAPMKLTWLFPIQLLRCYSKQLLISNYQISDCQFPLMGIIIEIERDKERATAYATRFPPLIGRSSAHGSCLRLERGQ